MTTTTRITSLSLDDLSGKSAVPQPATLPSPNAPPIPTDASSLHTRIGRAMLEYRWMHGGSPACANFYFSDERAALMDARLAARALASALEVL
jgi:hypothetical protein